MTRWPLWRVLVWVEAWLISVAAFHHSRPIHEDFVVPLLIGVVPGIALVALWGVARAAAGHGAVPDQRATWLEVSITLLSLAGAVMWIGQWAFDARQNLQRVDEVLGRATVIVDVSLTGLSAAACLAALALDWILATAHEQLRAAMTWLRRTHLVVTVVYVVTLFGAAWLLTQGATGSGADAEALFTRARLALFVYEFTKATVFPVQAFFAAMAVLVVAVDSRQAGT